MASNGEVRVDVSFNMDSVKKGLNKVNSAIKSSMSAVANVGSAALDGIKNLTVGVGAAATASAAAVTALGKQSIEAYANYEQLVGGVETLFKESAGIVENYAKHAFETAGMSANEYMETVTSFSASLISSLGGDTQLASEQANVAITDMADNANKMGTDLESLRYAYAGFAKQNYTMLDNLRLGFGGSREEMQRLLKEAQKISGIEYDISNFSDVVSAIHVIQTELHISGLTADEAAKAVAEGLMTEEEAYEAMGTTAREANYTIEGSVRAMKSSWENLLVGLADETQDVDELIDTLLLRIDIVLNNIMPRIEQFLKSFISRLPKMLSGFKDVGKRIVTTISNGLKSNSSAIQDGLKDFLENINKALIESLPNAVENAYNFFKNVFDLVATRIATLDPSKIFNTISTVINEIFDHMTKDMEDVPDFDNKFLGLIYVAFTNLGGIVEDISPYINGFITQLFDAAKNFIQSNDWSMVMQGIGETITQLISDLYDSQLIPNTIQKTGELINASLESIGVFTESLDLSNIGANLIGILGQIFEGLVPEFPKAIQNFGHTVANAIKNLDLTEITSTLGDVVSAIMRFIVESAGSLLGAVGEILGSIAYMIMNQDYGAIFINLLEAFTQGVSAFAISAMGEIANLVGGLGEWFISLGETKLSEFGDMLYDAVNTAMDFLTGTPEKMVEIGTEIINGLLEGLAGLGDALMEAFRSGATQAYEDFINFWHIGSPSKLMFEVGQNITQGLINGIDSKEKGLISATDDINQILADGMLLDTRLSASSLMAASYSGSNITNNNISQTYTVGSMDVTNNKTATAAIDELCNAIQIYSNQKPILA